ncbi:MAG: deoxyribonuclease IV, partial [Phycisphaerae bacterium]
RGSALTADQIKAYASAQIRTGLTPVVAHASYLLNLASPDSGLRKKSVDALADEHDRCGRLGVDFLVLHPGAHLDGTPTAGIKNIARGLDAVHRRAKDNACMILLETTAGQGTALGYRLEQLGAILDRVKEREVFGVCLDTCHLFAAGYDFRKEDGYQSMIEALNDAVGVTSVKCIHANDSKRECGSRVDRHEHIGKGKIGKSGFRHFVNDPHWSGLPFILETPKGKDGRGTDLDKVNLRRLRSLLA